MLLVWHLEMLRFELCPPQPHIEVSTPNCDSMFGDGVINAEAGTWFENSSDWGWKPGSKTVEEKEY